MKAAEQKTSADVEPRDALDKLRFLSIGAALHSKGPRMFVIEIVPHGVLIRATDKALIHVLQCSALTPFDQFRELTEDEIKLRLRQIDTELDREIAMAQ